MQGGSQALSREARTNRIGMRTRVHAPSVTLLEAGRVLVLPGNMVVRCIVTPDGRRLFRYVCTTTNSEPDTVGRGTEVVTLDGTASHGTLDELMRPDKA